MATPHWGLPQPAGSDLISQGDDVISSFASLMDDHAKFGFGTLAGRGTAASRKYGFFYLATDVPSLSVSDGTNWSEIPLGGGQVPIGAVIDYSGSGDPADTNYLLADGRAISRTTYANLFALIGTTFGAGDGSTTFNIPDHRGRITVSQDNMGTAAGAAGRRTVSNARGNTGGAETFTLTVGQLPSHAHGVGSIAGASAGDHSHSAGTLATGSAGDHSHTPGSLSTDSAGSHSHGGSTTGDGAHYHNPQLGDHMYYTPGSGGFYLATSSTPYGFQAITIYHWSGPVGVAHNHGISTDGAHTHGLSGSTSTTGAHTHSVSGSTSTTGAHTHTMSGSTANAGSGDAIAAHDPFIVQNKIIRVK